MDFIAVGRVVGHELFEPDPKNAPGVEVAKVTLVLGSLSNWTTKATRMAIHVDPEALRSEFALGRKVSVSLRDRQQELPLAPERVGTTAAGERFDTETGELLGGAGEGAISTITLSSGGTSVTTTPAGMRRALDEVKRSRRAVEKALDEQKSTPRNRPSITH